MFICTANVLDTIPGPVARPHGGDPAARIHPRRKSCRSRAATWCPRQLEATGLAAGQCEIGDDALAAIIDDYTREAG
jgi:ATP-dependent Lon protease